MDQSVQNSIGSERSSVNKKSEHADWDALWQKKFTYNKVGDLEKDIFIEIANLLRSHAEPKILSAGCGRALVDHWLIKVFGWSATLLDDSQKCVENLAASFPECEPGLCSLYKASIFSMPFPDNTFDLVWNAGVLEHFSKGHMVLALKEMARVSKKYVLVDVPCSDSKAYMLAKKWLEDHGKWVYGEENPQSDLTPYFSAADMEVVKQLRVGSVRTNQNYIKMLPEAHRHEIESRVSQEDLEIFPHLLTIGVKKGQ